MAGRSRKTVVAIAALGALALGGATLAHGDSSSSGDRGEHATGSGADQATAAALRITHGGRANSVERDGENGATWEVEVTKKDGKTVDVRLDQGYGLVVVEGDSESN